MSQASAMPAALDYLLFDPAPYAFGPAALPILPALHTDALRWHSGSAAPVPAWLGDGSQPPRLYSRARYALQDAYRLSGVGPQGALLAPGYHCRTMLDPALALGAPVLLYALHADLSLDLDDIARQLRGAVTPIKAVLASHFFGLAQDMAALAALCRQHGATLIEDCAHALPLKRPFNRMGATGTWCVSSPYKFFPCEDGGALWSGTGQTAQLPPLRAATLRTELGQLRRMLAKARQPRLVVAGSPVVLPTPDAAQRLAQGVTARLRGPSVDFEPGQAALSCTAVSRWVIGHTDVAQLVERRRKHYQRWVAAVQPLHNARALRPELGEHDTPYMFPLLIDQPDHHFAALKRAGLPIWRWDSLATSACPTAARYRLTLLQLPCHQSLSDAALAWMVGTLGQVLAASPGQSPA